MQPQQVSKQTGTMAERYYAKYFEAVRILWDSILLEISASGASVNQAIAATAGAHGKTVTTMESEIIEFANMCNIKFYGNWSQAPEWILSMMNELGWTFSESKVLSPAKEESEAHWETNTLPDTTSTWD